MPNPDRLARGMSARLLAEWQAFAAIEPFGPPADHWRSGLIAALLHNVNRSNQTPVAQPQDYMPKTMTEGLAPSDDELSDRNQAVLESLAQMEGRRHGQ